MGNMNAIAKIKNRTPKPDSKTQQEKKAKDNHRQRIVCEKCKKGNTTLYNIKGHYFCINCKNKRGGLKNDSNDN